MYKPGDLEIVRAEDEDWTEGVPSDIRSDEGDVLTYPFVRLPHSCSEWVIGNVQQIDDFIADLTEAKIALLVSARGKS